MTRAPNSPVRASRSPRLVGLAVAAVTAVVATAVLVTGAVRADGPDPVAVTVQVGATVRTVEVEVGAPLGDALTEAGVRPTDGRLLSAASQTVLTAAHRPARILLDGSPADEATPIAAGSPVVEVIHGVDETEVTRTVEEELPAPPGSDVLRHVEERGAAGLVRIELGAVSGEEVARQVLREPRAPAPTTRKVVALTFDDGPSPSWTPYVLAILQSRGVHATFCMVGTAVQKHPDLARQVVAEGHQVCNHTQTHDTGLVGADQARIDAEVRGGRSTLIDHGLPAPATYRPPGGHLSDEIVATARSQGEQVVMWKVDTKDWQRTATVESVMANVREQVEPGAVILLHDGGGTNRHTSVAVLAGLIDELRAQGYEFTFPIIDPA